MPRHLGRAMPLRHRIAFGRSGRCWCCSGRRFLLARRLLDLVQCLFGFPRPSGANGHRARHYAERWDALKLQAHRWLRETA